MTSSTALSALLQLYWPHIPFHLLWIIGAVIAIVRWRYHPTVSLLSLIAFLLLLLDSLVGIFVVYFVIYRGDFSSAERGWTMTLVNIPRMVVQMVGWGLLLGALFGWRSQPRVLMFPDDAGASPEMENDTGIRRGRSI